jgi:hypothetical protein
VALVLSGAGFSLRNLVLARFNQRRPNMRRRTQRPVIPSGAMNLSFFHLLNVEIEERFLAPLGMTERRSNYIFFMVRKLQATQAARAGTHLHCGFPRPSHKYRYRTLHFHSALLELFLDFRRARS